MRTRTHHVAGLVLAAAALALAAPAFAADLAADPTANPAAASGLTPAPMPNRADPLGYHSGVAGYFDAWYTRSDAARASQPHWMTPLVTVTPRLEQEVRYDQYQEHLGNGANISQYDSGKGLELIPTTTNEILLNPPGYLNRSGKKAASGWNDWQFLVVKQRLLSANEEDGNYIVSVFLGLQAPSGNAAFTNHAWIVTPTLAVGKGWGDFDIQSTLSVSVPSDHGSLIGTAIAWNTTFQYQVATYFWPEIETNITHWDGGLRSGKTQVMLTPGLILGRFSLNEQVKAIIGAGYQFAVSPKLIKEPVLTPIYDHAYIVTARLTF